MSGCYSVHNFDVSPQLPPQILNESKSLLRVSRRPSKSAPRHATKGSKCRVKNSVVGFRDFDNDANASRDFGWSSSHTREGKLKKAFGERCLNFSITHY